MLKLSSETLFGRMTYLSNLPSLKYPLRPKEDNRTSRAPKNKWNVEKSGRDRLYYGVYSETRSAPLRLFTPSASRVVVNRLTVTDHVTNFSMDFMRNMSVLVSVVNTCPTLLFHTRSIAQQPRRYHVIRCPIICSSQRNVRNQQQQW